MSTTTSPTVRPEAGWKEAWTLSDCGTQPDGSPIIRLQRLGSADPGQPDFSEGRNAWDHGMARARTGFALHYGALRQVDRVERTLIKASCGSW